MTCREFRFNHTENVNEFYPKDTQECIPVGCVPPAAVSMGGGWPSVMAFCCGLLLCPSGLVAF